MPPKADVNRAGRETTDFPSVCESCLGVNPYIQMIKEESGLECKICTRPFTVFRWSVDRTVRNKKTAICLTCARLKNCCQCCMLDLSFGLPIAIRDAALKLVAQGPNSDINKQYYAQNHEGELKDGDVPEEYAKTDVRARDLLKRLANSEPYYRRRKGDSTDGGEEGVQKRIGYSTGGAGGVGGGGGGGGGPGPVRNRGGIRGGGWRGGRGGNRGGRFPHPNQLPPGPQDYLPPQDQSITSLFLMGYIPLCSPFLYIHKLMTLNQQGRGRPCRTSNPRLLLRLWRN
jgi:pre-mRNA-splicing factor RBM22/SLT11